VNEIHKTDRLAEGAPEDLELRDRLVTGAVRLFAARGYAAVSVREICAAAGATKPMLYYYFGSKEGLYNHLIESVYEGFLTLLSEVEAQRLPLRQALVRYAEAHLRWAQEAPDHARLVFANALGPLDSPGEERPNVHRLAVDRLSQLIAADQGPEAAIPAVDLTLSFIGAVVLACLRFLSLELDEPLAAAERAAAVVETFLAGARAQGGLRCA